MGWEVQGKGIVGGNGRGGEMRGDEMNPGSGGGMRGEEEMMK